MLGQIVGHDVQNKAAFFFGCVHRPFRWKRKNSDEAAEFCAKHLLSKSGKTIRLDDSLGSNCPCYSSFFSLKFWRGVLVLICLLHQLTTIISEDQLPLSFQTGTQSELLAHKHLNHQPAHHRTDNHGVFSSLIFHNPSSSVSNYFTPWSIAAEKRHSKQVSRLAYLDTPIHKSTG